MEPKRSKICSDSADILKELHVVLCKFKLEDLRDYAIIDFPETTWSLVCALIQQSSEDLKPKTVADAIVYLMKKNLTDKQVLEDRIETLRLRAFGLSTTKTWFAYEFVDPLPDYEDMTLNEIAMQIGRSMHTPVLAIRATQEFDSVLLGIGRSRSMTVMYVTERRLLISKKGFNPKHMEATSRSFGFNSVKNCHLSGHHIPSLLQILDRKKGTRPLEAVISKPVYDLAPRRTRFGLDFTTEEPMQNYLNELLGDEENAPRLSNLTVRAKAPLNNGQVVFSKAVLSSANIGNSLRDMASLNIISPSSIFFSMMTEHCKNDLKVKLS